MEEYNQRRITSKIRRMIKEKRKETLEDGLIQMTND